MGEDGNGGGEGRVEDESQVRCLDLTSFQLHDLGEVEIPESLVELDLTENRLTELDPRIGFLSHLKKLSLRQNLLDDESVEPITRWNTISGLSWYSGTTSSEKYLMLAFSRIPLYLVSFNEISSLNGLSKISNTLEELYVSKNEVTKVEELEHLHAL